MRSGCRTRDRVARGGPVLEGALALGDGDGTEHDVNEVRDEILAEGDGHNVDGDYAALPDFV